MKHLYQTIQIKQCWNDYFNFAKRTKKNLSFFKEKNCAISKKECVCDQAIIIFAHIFVSKSPRLLSSQPAGWEITSSICFQSAGLISSICSYLFGDNHITISPADNLQMASSFSHSSWPPYRCCRKLLPIIYLIISYHN